MPTATATPTLADRKAERERLEAQRAQRDFQAAERDSISRAATVRAGLLLRDAALAALDRLLAHWQLDLSGQTDETRAHHAMSLAAHDVLSSLAPAVRGRAEIPADVAERFVRGATPRQVLTVSQWAARHRVLRSGTNSPGPWNNEVTPYLVEIMDALSEHSPVRYVTFKKSSGVGGTEVLYNWIGYVMHHLQNKDMLMVLGSLELRDRSFNPRLAKIIDESPALSALVSTSSRDRSNRADLLEYGPRARLIKAGANSPDSMRSDHLPYVACDEVSAFPWDVGGEGDPMTLIENRQRTFSRAKSLYVSTPLEEGTCRISRLFEQSDQRHYHVPCPHCDELQPLEFGGTDVHHGLKWRTAPRPDPVPGQPPPPAQVLSAWYVCRACGAEIAEKHKPAMLAAGRWVAGRPHIKHHRGYYINALYAPVGLGLGWRTIAQKWLDAQGDRAELKSFVNTYKGETWAEDGEGADPTALLTRAEPYTVTAAGIEIAQDGGSAVIIPIRRRTAGVDVQKDRLEALACAWTDGEECWPIEHLILPGDTTQPDVWTDLHDALRDLGVNNACIDAGYNTSVVQQFCSTRTWATPTKGIPGSHRPLIEDELKRKQRLRRRRKAVAPIEPLGVDQGKGLLVARLKQAGPGPGYIHIPQHPSIDDEWCLQLTAEKLVTKYRGHRPMPEWVRTRPRNEALDCWVLALAALRLSGLKLLRIPTPARSSTPANPPGNPEPAAASSDQAIAAPRPPDATPVAHQAPAAAPSSPPARPPEPPAPAAQPAAPPTYMQHLIRIRRSARH